MNNKANLFRHYLMGAAGVRVDSAATLSNEQLAAMALGRTNGLGRRGRIRPDDIEDEVRYLLTGTDELNPG